MRPLHLAIAARGAPGKTAPPMIKGDTDKTLRENHLEKRNVLDRGVITR